MFTSFAFIKRKIILPLQKLLIAGQFTSFRTTSYGRLIKITPTTAIDTTFNMGSGTENTIFTSAIDENGKILIGGAFTSYSGSSQYYITRINTNGTRDTTFNIGLGFDSWVYTILPVSQSKVLVGGFFTSYSGSVYNYLTRINSNGTVDSTFTNPLLSNLVYTVATQSDGKIIAAGDFTSIGYPEPYLAKIDSQLNPVTAFNPGSGPSSPVFTFATQSDGKILFGGQFTTYSGSSANRIERINTDGTIDTSFNQGVGFNGDVYDIKVQSDNKILVGGAFSSYSGSSAQNRIIRLNSNGTIDATFVKGTGFSAGTVYDMQLQSDGKIIVNGTFSGTYSGSTTPRIVRINTSGSKDLTFNSGTTGFSVGQYSAQIQNDGKIVVVGPAATYSGSTSQRIRRINTDGTLDTTFNIGATGLNNTSYRVKIQPDQKIVVLGAFTSYSGSAVNRLIRINSDGTRDTSLAIGTGFNTVGGTLPLALELDSSGSIYVGSNSTTYSGSAINNFIKLNSSGSIITGSGLYNGFNSNVNALLVDSTGSVYAGGAFSAYMSPQNRIIRLNTDGTRDTTFNIGTGFNVQVNSLVVQPDDKIIVGGNFTTYSGSSQNYVTRLDTSGTRDTTFNIGTGFNTNVFKVSLQSDNKVLVTGEFTTYSGSSQNYITRINPDGTRDTTFNIGTGANAYTTNTLSDIKQDQSGNIHYANRGMTSYSGSSVTGYVKLTSSGSIDPTFLSTAASASSTPGAYTQGTDSTGVASISIDSSNNAYLFGNFQNYLNISSSYLTSRVLALELTSGDISRPPNFGTGFNGSVSFSTKTPSGDIWLAMTSTAYNQIYSGSTIPSQRHMVKINPQGTFTGSTGVSDLQTTTIAAQSDEKLLVGYLNQGGGATGNMYRQFSDGQGDSSFQSQTYFDNVYTIKQQSNGNILIGGDFQTSFAGEEVWETMYPFYLTRLNSSGSQIGLTYQPSGGIYNINVLPDDSFIITGVSDFGKLDSTGSIITSYNVGSGFNSTVFNSTLQPDGKLIAAGGFTSYSGSAINEIARINTDGTLDTTFNPGSGFDIFNSRLSKIVIDQENNIHVVGPFTTYSGSQVNGYVKILPNGNIHPQYTGSLSRSPIGVYTPNFVNEDAYTMELLNY